MGKEYHPDTSETRPFSHEKQVVEADKSPGRHYSPDSGEWDGQLPNAELVRNATPDYPDYPGPVARRQWATAVGIEFNLSAGERSILQAYAHDAGTPRGCWKSAATMAHELGYNEDFIRDGRKKLIKLGILVDQGRRNRVQRVTLNMNVTGPETRFAQDQTGSHTRLQENVTGSDTRLHPSSDQTKPGVTPGYEDQTGCHTGSKPGVTPGKHKGTKRKERENYLSLSFSSISNSGSPGLTPGYDSRNPTLEDAEIERLVEGNWSLLKQFWNHQGGATTTYRRKGLDFTIQDIAEKREKAGASDLAARTCVHCRTVRDTADEVKACVRCEDPICVDDRSSCRQINCHRKHGRSRKQDPQSDRLRR